MPKTTSMPSIGATGWRPPDHLLIDIVEYNRMIDVGALSHRRCELIDGEIVDMPPVGYAHILAVQDLYDLLRAHFPNPWFLKCQATQRTGKRFAPEPDLVLLQKRPRRAQIDDEPALLVEVSDSTLSRDLSVKKLRYAQHGIRDYWVVNLHERIVHVFREPRADATTHEAAYASEVKVGVDGELAPLVDPTKRIRVADFMPEGGAEPDETA